MTRVKRSRTRSPGRPAIGIVGAGRMGGWFTWFFQRRGFPVAVFDKVGGRARELSKKTGAQAVGDLGSLAEGSDIILIATPPWEVRGVLQEVADHAREGQLVFDIATFKTHVIEAYSVLPPGVQAASAHPLFGPGAPISNPGAFKVITIPIEGREGEEGLRRFFSDLGFRVETMDWREHDRVMALTIGVSFAVGVLNNTLLLEQGLENLLEKSGSSFKALAIHALSLLNQDEKLVEYVLSLPLVREAVEEYSRRLLQVVENPKQAVSTLEKARREFGIEWMDAAYVSLYRAIETFTLE